jgi:hypothetical protein
MLSATKKIIDSSELQNILSKNARETAIKHFHIKNYLKKWQNVFLESLR